MKKKILIVISAILVLTGVVFAASKSKATASNDTSVIQLIDISKLEHRTQDESAPVVYFIRDISSQSMLRLYDTLG